MGVNPFPWHRPREDRRAGRPEPLSSPGFGSRRTPPDEPLSIGAWVALIACLVFPLCVIAYGLALGLPPIVLAAIGAGVLVIAFLAIRRAVAARRRAAARAAQRASRSG